MKIKKLAISLTVLFFLWTAVIFYFSSQPPEVSHSQSRIVVQIIGGINNIFDFTDTGFFVKIENVLGDFRFLDKYKTPNALVRKSAHFGIYFILGIIACAFGYTYTRKILIAFLLGGSLPVVVAVLDEYNQSQIGRTSSLTDVLIDGGGALTGTIFWIFLILIFKFISFIKGRIRSKSRKKNTI
ncbi:VanZ family protein [Dehalobacterium formicoaceticum]|uniref:VanZ family protein n=1 Tax=Dehalobacterium formicoaceticum TaxID=51515 RepID=A0ABT1YA78_9FIRM|nr:VanZ family protein [Dehalobacterium formicoaceticum]MCR6546834.1 VanZ family protein [Dehalobacterium formicoaceticum]